MFGFHSSSKKNRKSSKNTTTPINTTTEAKILYNVPSVSQIAPLPQNKSLGMLPVLSRDGRDAPNIIQSEPSENELTANTTTLNSEGSRQPVGEYIRSLDPT
jgi:hypothetical protein